MIGTRLRVTALRLGFRTIFGLPRVVKRTLAGAQVRVEDQGLDLDVQLLYRIGSLFPAARAARWTRRRSPSSGGRPTCRHTSRRPRVRRHPHPGSGPWTAQPAPRPARLYEPEAVGTPGPLLVFFHGGGFALGSLTTADPLCRLIAAQAQLRVLSVSYRLAPEHPYPAGLDDALAAFDWVRAHAAELGADAELVALGGDSAGGNLALVTAHERPGGAAFVMALYPVTDVARTGGSRDTFGSGFGLSADTVASLERFYLPDGVPDDDRRGAIVRADDLSAMPPVYLATAGFDPLRDEGEELAERLRRAGVPVTGRRFPGLVHGYAGLTAISATARDATLDAASALRAGLALAGRTPASSTALTPGTPSRSGSAR